MKKQLLLCVVVVLSLSGCATIVRGRTQDIKIGSSPGEASYQIRDDKGRYPTLEGKTPDSVTLKRGAGYFRGSDYTVTLSKPGYQSATVHLASGMNGWYIGGNLLLGGLIGYLAVDPATGAMWTLKPKELQVTLTPLLGAGQALVETQPVVPFASPVAPAPAPAAAASRPRAVAGPVALMPGSARAINRIALRSSPLIQAAVVKNIPAGDMLDLQTRAVNNRGAWWYASYQGVEGWVTEQGLSQ